MTIEKFEEIMSNEDTITNFEDGCRFRGIEIIRKYIPDADIEAAAHDVIYCCTSEKLVDAGISQKDAEHLRALNWMIDEESLASYV